MKRIRLKDCTASAMVDDADHEALARYEWRLHGTWGHAYAVRIRDGKAEQLANAVMGDPPPGMLWDHKNGNGLDNRRDNLRLATPTQNNRNRRKQRSATSSRYKGVSRKGARWLTQIRVSGRVVRLGTFRDEWEAARAYDQAARRYHGPFACVNFPRKGERAALRPFVAV